MCRVFENRPITSNLPATVLTLLQNSGVTLKLNNPFLPDDQLLRPCSTTWKMETSRTTTKTIRELQGPTTQTVVRSFLGPCDVFRWVLPNVLWIVADVEQKMQKGLPKSFSKQITEEKQSVDDFKEILTNPQELAPPPPIGHYALDTNDCDTQVGYVLL